jgi:hypothetical protein
MNKFLDLVNLHAGLGRALDHLRPLLLFATRVWVSWQFLKSGWLKISSWDVSLPWPAPSASSSFLCC